MTIDPVGDVTILDVLEARLRAALVNFVGGHTLEHRVPADHFSAAVDWLTAVPPSAVATVDTLTEQRLRAAMHFYRDETSSSFNPQLAQLYERAIEAFRDRSMHTAARP